MVAACPAATTWKSDTTEAFRAETKPALVYATTLQVFNWQDELRFSFALEQGQMGIIKTDDLRVYPKKLEVRVELERGNYGQ